MDSKTQKVLHFIAYADNENCFVFMRNYYLHRRFLIFDFGPRIVRPLLYGGELPG
jgi:hypothetical protein